MRWCLLIVLAVLACQGGPGPTPPRPAPLAGFSRSIASHRLELRIVPEDSGLQAQDVVTVSGAGDVLRFQLLDGLKVQAVELAGRSLRFRAEGVVVKHQAQRSWVVELPAELPVEAEVRIRYGGGLTRPSDAEPGLDRIAQDGVYLLRGWYPDQRRHLADFQLRAELPAGWRMATPAPAQVESVQGATARVLARLARPLPSFPLAAGPFRAQEQTAAGVPIAVLLRTAAPEVAGPLIARAAEYLATYSRLLGPYPFEKLELVEGPPSSGVGLPGMVLLARAHLEDPDFLEAPFLGHEIVHAWWGHHVAVEGDGGDWCEGLTTYVANHYHLELGEAARAAELSASYRARASARYNRQVGREAPYSLADDGASGYAKAAMFFHDLRRRIGTAAFFQGLRQVVTERGGDYASWDDFRRAFEAAAGRPLGPVFEQWLSRRGLPEPALVSVRALDGQPPVAELSFVQRSDEVYDLELEVELECEGAEPSRRVLHIDRERVDVRLEDLPGPILRVRVDPDHHLLRYRPGPVGEGEREEAEVVDAQRP